MRDFAYFFLAEVMEKRQGFCKSMCCFLRIRVECYICIIPTYSYLGTYVLGIIISPIPKLY